MAAKLAITGTNLKHEAGDQSMGGHIGSTHILNDWIKAQVAGWEHRVKSLGKIVRRFPQTDYAGLVKSLQNEWNYLQRVTSGNGNLYEPIKKAIRDNFLPALLN